MKRIEIIPYQSSWPSEFREIASILGFGMRARIAELRAARGAVDHVARRTYRAFGRGESQISQACRGVVDGVAGPKTGWRTYRHTTVSGSKTSTSTTSG